MEFILTTHTFHTVFIRFPDATLKHAVQQFMADVERRPQHVPAVAVLPLPGSFEDDYARIGLAANNAQWRVATGNSDYQVALCARPVDQPQICPTYSRAFVVPRTISDSVVRHAARFRSRQRLPIMSYLHADGTTIFRSSQALVGLQRSRSIQDERLVDAIRLACPKRELLIADARPRKSAMANVVAGAGFMPLEHYEKCQRVYLGIENIHHVRDSYFGIFELMLGGSSLRNAMHDSGWIKHYTAIMEGVKVIVESVLDGVSVLVHCSDGWDRTAQLVSLAQLCLDPYTRTIDGLIALVRREWLAAGHQFRTRLAKNLSVNSLDLDGKQTPWSRVLHSLTRSSGAGNGSGNENRDGKEKVPSADLGEAGEEPKGEFCPIFPQFLDCAMQLVCTYPAAFEFNLMLLHDLCVEAHVSDTHTFTQNCERQQAQQEGGSEQLCYWATLNAQRKKYLNNAYRPDVFPAPLPITRQLLNYLPTWPMT